MKLFAQMVGVGIAGVVALKVLGWLVLPVLALVTGLLGLVLKLALVLVVGWFAIQLFNARRRKAA